MPVSMSLEVRIIKKEEQKIIPGIGKTFLLGYSELVEELKG